MTDCVACNLKMCTIHVPFDITDYFNKKNNQWYNERVDSEYHGHGIVPWAVEEICYFCQYPASHKVGEEDIYDFHNMTAYVCCDHFWSTCRNSDAPRCDKCRHPWHQHETEIILSNRTVFECVYYTGMGDWCGCEEKRQQ